MRAGGTDLFDSVRGHPEPVCGEPVESAEPRSPSRGRRAEADTEVRPPTNHPRLTGPALSSRRSAPLPVRNAIRYMSVRARAQHRPVAFPPRPAPVIPPVRASAFHRFVTYYVTCPSVPACGIARLGSGRVRRRLSRITLPTFGGSSCHVLRYKPAAASVVSEAAWRARSPTGCQGFLWPLAAATGPVAAASGRISAGQLRRHLLREIRQDQVRAGALDRQ
jgi:hypothetical protein